MSSRKDPKKASAIYVLFLIFSWYSTSIFLSMYNTWLFSEKRSNFKFPIFTISLHMGMQFALASISLKFFPKLQPKRMPGYRETITKIIPCAMAMLLDIGLSNSSLEVCQY
jgi:solute carrier family 35 protein C2